MELPSQFTFPFCYTPHPLCLAAANELQNYLKKRSDWSDELKKGKMFGVLIVRDSQGEVGYLAAFSGILAGSNIHSHFVPPIYDLLNPDGFFKEEEGHISALNRKIIEMENSDVYHSLCNKLNVVVQKAEKALSDYREIMKSAKTEREQRRKNVTLDNVILSILIKESQYQHAEYKRQEKYWNCKIEEHRQALTNYMNQINEWKKIRKFRSANLQKRLFDAFVLQNAKGESKTLNEIFEEYCHCLPPAGAGECAAPKLLQYAYLHQLQPLAMAEFWWGESPKSEIRRHGCFYPSCKHKCEPILKHMLEGLNVEPNPLLVVRSSVSDIKIVYEDEYLLVLNKPHGMLSVPGKDDLPSVFTYLEKIIPDATGPLIVHRLDMDTSGLLLVAKNKEVHSMLQILFETRVIKKKYIAFLDGCISDNLLRKGFIRLPLRPDYLNRPYQLVDEVDGKPSVTRYEILGTEKKIINGHMQWVTRVAFYPLTGRTHQLRVHSAHLMGLNLPIVGDSLYGQPSDRLYLHAESLEFRHPITGKRLFIEYKLL